MTIQRDLELRLRANFEERGDRSVPDGQVAAILTSVTRSRQRPSWLVALRSPSMTVITLERPAVPNTARLLLIGALLLAALAAGYLIAGARLFGPPTNGQIVFGRMNDALGDTEVFVMNPDGSHIRQLLPGTFEGPFWSPDGKRIGIGHSIVNADGTGFHAWNQSGNPFNIECWDWSPDGQRMLCEGFANDEASDAQVHGVYSVRASDGKDLVRLSQPGKGAIPGTYSRDGKLVVWVESCVDEGHCQLVVANVDGSNQRHIGTRLFSGGPTWAPDGLSILASSDGTLFSIDVATGKATAIKLKGSPGASIWQAQWSPDGSRILIKMFVGGSNNDLFTILPDGTDLVRITNDPDDDRFFDWGTHALEP